MAQLIIFPNDDGSVAVVSPAQDVDINTIIEAVVPLGKPHRIVLEGDLPPAARWVWTDNGPLIAATSSPTSSAVRAECARRLAAVVAGYTPEERETWPVQINEARAVAAGATDAPMLSVLAAARGLSLAAFASAVLQVTAATTTATATLLAAQARLLAQNPIPADFADDKWWV